MSSNDKIVKVNDEEDVSKLPNEHPKKLIPELCRLFYQLGWVTGILAVRFLSHLILKFFSRNWWWYFIEIQ